MFVWFAGKPAYMATNCLKPPQNMRFAIEGHRLGVKIGHDKGPS